METNVQTKTYTQLEQQMDAGSVLLLSEMYQTGDPYRQRELFDQSADQEATLISEVLEGSVKTDFSFDVRNDRLYLIQPGGVTDWRHMHVQGVQRARARASADALLNPYVDIALAELDEAAAQEAMIKAGQPAAMFKLSLCGDDVMPDDQLRKIGRNPQLQRAFARVTVFDGQKLYVHSRSIDGLSLGDGRRGIGDGWGTWMPEFGSEPDISSVDILNQTVNFDETEMPVEEMHTLVERVVAAFDEFQYERTGKVHKAGRSPEGIDTYKFVMDNQDLFSAHMDSMCELAQQPLPFGVLAATANDLRYDIMSSFKQRLEGTWIEHVSLAEGVAYAGSVERSAGTSYNGCDTVISASGNPEAAGYVNGTGAEKSLLDLIGKKLRCENKKCRKEVVVPTKDLRAGILSCNKCGLVYDVCNKKSSFDPSRISGQKENDQSSYRPETVSESLARYKAEREQKEARRKIREGELLALKKDQDLAAAA